MVILDWIKAAFNKFVGIFKAFVADAFPVVKQIIMGQLTAIAMKAVTSLDAGTLSNEDKRNAAFKDIKEYALLHGIEARDSLIFALIEIAVQKLKGV